MLSLFDGRVCVKCGAWKPFDAYETRDRDSDEVFCTSCKRLERHIKRRMLYRTLHGDPNSVSSDDITLMRGYVYGRPLEEKKALASASKKRWAESHRKPPKARVHKEKRPRKSTYKCKPTYFSRRGMTEEQKRQRRTAQAKVWRNANREHSTAYTRTANHKRRARVIGGGGSYTLAEWEALCAKYGHLCLRCGEHKPLTVDHVIPISKGGSNDISNLQPLCRSCNARKSVKSTDYRA